MPLGSEIESTTEPQTIASVRIYPERTAALLCFRMTAQPMDMRKAAGSVTKLTWDDKTHRLNHEGAPAWSGPDTSVVTVVSK